MWRQSSERARFPFVPKGKRATVAGRTGSGKTTLATWLLNGSPQHWLILNPKWTAGYQTLPDVKIIRGANLRKVEDSLMRNKFTVLNPDNGENNPEYLDYIIQHFHETMEGVGLCVDELYMIHEQGRAGSGLVGWLTRGRELKQSFLGLTQRPVWVSKFCFSEADYIGEMDLQLEGDRKTVYSYTGKPPMLGRLPEKSWYWYTAATDTATRFGAVPLLTAPRDNP